MSHRGTSLHYRLAGRQAGGVVFPPIVMTALKTFISVFALSSVQRDAALLGAISNQPLLFHISKEAMR